MKQLYEEVQLCYLNLQIPCLKLQFLQDGISCYKSGLWNEGNGILDWLYLAQDRDRWRYPVSAANKPSILEREYSFSIFVR